jgi:CRP-like cAMP-binding protein
MIDLYQKDEFFGESSLINLPNSGEQAMALEDTKLMTWGTAALEGFSVRRPLLGMALLQILVQRTSDFTKRLESFCVDDVERRLARSLVRFSERFGTVAEDGSVHMMAFTHELLGQYVGTSREIVTHYMNKLRREGYLLYSRKGIILKREALREWLRQRSSGKVIAASTA